MTPVIFILDSFIISLLYKFTWNFSRERETKMKLSYIFLIYTYRLGILDYFELFVRYLIYNLQTYDLHEISYTN